MVHATLAYHWNQGRFLHMILTAPEIPKPRKMRRSMPAFCPSVHFPVALLALSLSAPAAAAGLEGTWKWSWTDQSGTEHQRALKIRGEGEKLSGLVIRDEGSETPVKDLKIEGDRL